MKDKIKCCPNCHQPIDRPMENAEEKLKLATAKLLGQQVYTAVLNKHFNSIDLCNWCYSTMQSYRYSLSKEQKPKEYVAPMRQTKTNVAESKKSATPKELDWYTKVTNKAKKFWAKYEKQPWWKYYQSISPTINSFIALDKKDEEIIPNGEDIRDMKFAVAKEIEQIIKNRTQECYLQCLAAECGEGECADAIATKFPNDVSRYQDESNPFDSNNLLKKGEKL